MLCLLCSLSYLVLVGFVEEFVFIYFPSEFPCLFLPRNPIVPKHLLNI